LIILNEFLDEFSVNILKENQYMIYLLEKLRNKYKIIRYINTYYHIMNIYKYVTSNELRNHLIFMKSIFKWFIY